VAGLSVVNNLRCDAWNEILAQTRAMLAAGEAGDWDQVAVLERERQKAITRFFRDDSAPHEAVWLQQGIEQLLGLDDRLLALCQAGRAEASAAVVELRRKAVAKRSYADTATG
jgi:hypothetical protein